MALANLEHGFYNFIVNHSIVLEERIPIVKVYLQDYGDSSLNAVKEFGPNDVKFTLRISDNPIMSYRMIRRYHQMIRLIYEEMSPIEKQSLMQHLGEGKTEMNEEMLTKWISTADLEDAIEAILRIHHVYNVNLDEFTSGNILGTHTNVDLTGQQCQEIGEYAIEAQQFTLGILWLETALNKTERSQDLNATYDILKVLQTATGAHDTEWCNNEGGRDYYFFQKKLNESSKDNRISIRDVEFSKVVQKPRKFLDCEPNSWGLCSGENYQTNEEISHLFCRYEKNNGAWIIDPLKIEQLSISPYIVQIYDVLRDEAIAGIKEEVVPDLTRSIDIGYNYIPIIRDSFHTHLTHSGISRFLARRTELITGLVVTPPHASEKFYMEAYPLGGVVGCHTDYLEQVPDGNGNRIATIMYYVSSYYPNKKRKLSDVEIGGGTIFSTVGVGAKPVKGSALFWYNMLRNREPDTKTEHAGCPVVLGQKWTAHKAIRANAQIHARPCGLNRNE